MKLCSANGTGSRPSVTTTDDRHSLVRIDPFDRDILKYMLLWDPHGALYDEDLFPEFGMNVQQFHERFVQLATSYDRRRLDHADLVLVEGARRYLRQVGSGSKAFARMATSGIHHRMQIVTFVVHEG